MKKLTKCFLLAASALMLLAGCSGLSTGDATVDSIRESGNICSLSISIDGVEPAPVNNNVARTIYAPAYNGGAVAADADAPAITSYVLKGESVTTGAKLGTAGAGITLGSADAEGHYTVEIPYGVWELTLEARAGDVVVLQGKSFKELKTSKSLIPFTLTSEGVTTAGHVKLGGTFVDTDNVAEKYSAGLYDTVTGDLIAGTALTLVEVGTDPAHSFDYDISSVDLLPGRYSFQIKFVNWAGTQVGYWEDTVIVAPGRTTINTTLACGDIINRLPYHPENLCAFLETGSEDAEGYTVILTWQDKSSNEENFVITVDEYSDDSSSATKTTYKILGVTAPASDTDKHEVFFTSPINAGGSIRASSESASLKLPFGKVFEVSIQAENFVGLSEKFAPDEDGIETAAAASLRITADLPTGVTAPAGSTFINSAKINRMVIDYDLNGGVLTCADTNAVYSGHYIDYKSIYEYAADARVLPAALLTIDDSDLTDTTKNRLVAGANEFTSWTKADGTAFAATDTLTFAGLSVKASYDPTSSISIETSDFYNSITATVKSGDTDITNGEVVRTADAALPLTFAAALPTDSTATIDWIKVKVTGPDGKNVLTSGKESNPYTASLSKYNATGTYTVSITAHIDGQSQNETYSYTCTIKVKDN